MERRNFLKAMMAGGIYLGLGGVKGAWALGSSEHYFINVFAPGGWDPTSLCDPKGDILFSSSRGVINRYSVDAIRQAGNLRYAPLLDTNYTGVDEVDMFFQQHYADIRVFNGLNGQTNSHAVGGRLNRSGDSSPKQPDTAALMGALKKETKPLAYYLGSGGTRTGGAVAASRINDVSTLDKLANPNRYLSGSVSSEIDALHDVSMSKTQAALTTDADRRAMREFLEGHNNTAALNPLLDTLPNQLSSGNKGRAEIAAAAFKSGVSNSAMLAVGFFDSHSNNDLGQHNALMQYFGVMNHLIAELERHGIADKTTILMSSDFGRTPYYNGNSGKDHWTVGSAMIWSRVFPGNRVIGLTDGQVKSVKVDPVTFEPDEKGIELTPTHLHLALRQRLGILDSHLDSIYPLKGEVLDLLS